MRVHVRAAAQCVCAVYFLPSRTPAETAMVYIAAFVQRVQSGPAHFCSVPCARGGDDDGDISKSGDAESMDQTLDTGVTSMTADPRCMPGHSGRQMGREAPNREECARLSTRSQSAEHLSLLSRLTFLLSASGSEIKEAAGNDRDR